MLIDGIVASEVSGFVLPNVGVGDVLVDKEDRYFITSTGARIAYKTSAVDLTEYMLTLNPEYLTTFESPIFNGSDAYTFTDYAPNVAVSSSIESRDAGLPVIGSNGRNFLNSASDTRTSFGTGETDTTFFDSYTVVWSTQVDTNAVTGNPCWGISTDAGAFGSGPFRGFVCFINNSGDLVLANGRWQEFSDFLEFNEAAAPIPGFAVGADICYALTHNYSTGVVKLYANGSPLATVMSEITLSSTNPPPKTIITSGFGPLDVSSGYSIFPYVGSNRFQFQASGDPSNYNLPLNFSDPLNTDNLNLQGKMGMFSAFSRILTDVEISDINTIYAG